MTSKNAKQKFLLGLKERFCNFKKVSHSQSLFDAVVNT
jgi:hypothetical protein